MKITGRKNRAALKVSGTSTPIFISTGPWVEGVNPDLIKLRTKRSVFPTEAHRALRVESGSDAREDYFEADSIRLLPGHPLYEQAKASA